MSEQQCTKCLVVKPLNDFPNLKNGRNGKGWNCKECTNNYHRAYKKSTKIITDEQLMKYFIYKIQIIKKQDSNKFPDYQNVLTAEDLLEVYKKYKGVCTYSNKKLKSGSKASVYNKISFDRIDNDVPHEKDNLQLTSVFMNMMRGNKTDSEFREYIKNCS